VARCPSHARACVLEDHITTAISYFLDKCILGHDRTAMLGTHLPRTAAAAAAKRSEAGHQLTPRSGRNDPAAKGLITELAQLGDSVSPASVAYRDRIREHFKTLHDVTAALQARPARRSPGEGRGAQRRRPHRPDPLRTGLLARARDGVRAALYAALDVRCTYRADQNQVTIRAAITSIIPGIVAALTHAPKQTMES
jgi:hypothetical protein